VASPLRRCGCGDFSFLPWAFWVGVFFFAVSVVWGGFLVCLDVLFRKLSLWGCEVVVFRSIVN